MSAVPVLNIDLTTKVFVFKLQAFPSNNADADLLE